MVRMAEVPFTTVEDRMPRLEQAVLRFRRACPEVVEPGWGPERQEPPGYCAEVGMALP